MIKYGLMIKYCSMITLRRMMILGCLVFFTGCATTDGQLYYWGDYSNTLYRYTKEPSPKTREAHRRELVKIVGFAERNKRKAPPGIYAELGELTGTLGNGAEAASYFQKELESYPESEKIIRVITKKNNKE
jgi:hypothetical protein